jgi:phosphoribosylaminoimidazolecarboxamide formyltransferase/IMP cyclohydrolase
MNRPVRRALLSVSDKQGLVEFARVLAELGVEIISTGGTASTLAGAGLKVTLVEMLTGFPEILDGRVKTLHPGVHAGLLAVRDNAVHEDQMRRHALGYIDLLCVNLYPFERTIARPGCTRGEAIEQIDVGGPAMIRAAAKNHAYVAVVTSPAQYHRVAAELRANHGATTLSLRAELAREAFARICQYDATIAAYLAGSHDDRFPPLLNLSLVRQEELRYGENPHQRAALYRWARRHMGSLAWGEQLHGKELSYNNLLDADAALRLARDLGALDPNRCAAVIVKHTNPCGACIAPSVREAIEQALAGDPVASYGGILALSDVMDAHGAQRLMERDVFLEVIVAPSYEPEAIDLLRARWANVRLLAVGSNAECPDACEARTISGGLLLQDPDARWASPQEFVLRAGPEPGPVPRRTAAFLERVARALLSNAVCIGRADGEILSLVGAGAGQMDRVTACRLACEKAGRLAQGAVAFSDAFFPFPDGPEVLLDAGVSVIAHPGGSKRDQETFDLCARRNASCLTTGIRHFRH